jgi:hypothetical protein
MTITLPPRKARDGHFSFIPPVALKGRASIWPGRNKPPMAHDTSADRMASWRATQERLLAERGLLFRVELDAKKKKVTTRNDADAAIQAQWQAVHAKIRAERTGR